MNDEFDLKQFLSDLFDELDVPPWKTYRLTRAKDDFWLIIAQSRWQAMRFVKDRMPEFKSLTADQLEETDISPESLNDPPSKISIIRRCEGTS